MVQFTDRELDVMNVLWDRGPSTVAEVQAALSDRLAYTTVLTVLRLLESLDAFRRPERFEQFLLACEADFRGRPGYEDGGYPQAERLRRAHAAAAAVSGGELAREGLSGAAIGEELARRRVAAIAAE